MRVIAALLLLAVAGLPTMAYADPIDPTWLGGYWDDDDFDYVILLVTNQKAFLPAPVPVFQPTTEMVGVVAVVALDPPVIERVPPYRRRGPPRA